MDLHERKNTMSRVYRRVQIARKLVERKTLER